MSDPRPFDRTWPLSGRDLRHACLAILQGRARASIGDVLGALERAGFRVAGPSPRTTISEALRWEVKLGRVKRVAWGVYAVDRLPKTTAWRCRQRWLRAA